MVLLLFIKTDWKTYRMNEVRSIIEIVICDDLNYYKYSSLFNRQRISNQIETCCY